MGTALVPTEGKKTQRTGERHPSGSGSLPAFLQDIALGWPMGLQRTWVQADKVVVSASRRSETVKLGHLWEASLPRKPVRVPTISGKLLTKLVFIKPQTLLFIG